MYFVLGLLVAGLLALILLPAVWRRAVRLTSARMEARIPVSRAEIDADKDQLRANFAVANRRLEMEAGRLKDRLAGEVVEVGKRREEVVLLTRAKAALSDTIAGLEQRIEGLNETIARNEERIAFTESELSDRDRRLAETTAAAGGSARRL